MMHAVVLAGHDRSPVTSSSSPARSRSGDPVQATLASATDSLYGAIGNHVVQALLSERPAQPTSSIRAAASHQGGLPHALLPLVQQRQRDPFEQEADAVADRLEATGLASARSREVGTAAGPLPPALRTGLERELPYD